MIKMETKEDLGFMRRKRTKRPRPLSPLSLTIATSSCSTESPGGGGGGGGEEEDMANCLILLARSCNKNSSPEDFVHETQHNKASSASATTVMEKDVYQCKTCNRSFHSFQALGGHRASHKKPRPPASSTAPENQESQNLDQLKEEQNTMLSLQIPNRVFSCNNTSHTKQRVHECSTCGAEFNSGQALGGHMRRHRPIPIVPSTNNQELLPSQVKKKQRMILSLDLNLPAPDEDDQIDAKFPFPPSREQVIVFSTSPLVDCHYY